jgi:hypothetical protein
VAAFDFVLEVELREIFECLRGQPVGVSLAACQCVVACLLQCMGRHAQATMQSTSLSNQTWSAPVGSALCVLVYTQPGATRVARCKRAAAPRAGARRLLVAGCPSSHQAVAGVPRPLG